MRIGRSLPLTSLLFFALVGCGESDSDDSGDLSGPDNPSEVDNQKSLSEQYNAALSDVSNASQSVDSAYQSALDINESMTLSEVESRVDGFLDALLEYAQTLRSLDEAGNQIQVQSAMASLATGIKSVGQGERIQAYGLFDDLIGFLPGASNVGVANAKAIEDTVAKAKEKGENLKRLVESGDIEADQYGNTVMSELSSVVSTGAGWVFSGFAGVVGGAAAGAAGLTMLPALAVGAATGGVAGVVYNYVFTAGETENGECVSNCAVVTGSTNEKGQALIPADMQGELVLSRSDRHPVSIPDFEISESEANTALTFDEKPVTEPFEPVEIAPEEPELSPTCADVASLSAGFEAMGAGEVWATVKTAPEVSGCSIDLTGGRIYSDSETLALDSQRFTSGEILSISGPAYGDFTVSMNLRSVASGTRRTLSANFEQDGVGIVSISPVNPDFWLKTGETVFVDDLAFNASFIDGSSRVVMGSTDSAIQWQFAGGVGNYAQGAFQSAEPGMANFTVSYEDSNEKTVSTTYTIRVETDEEPEPPGDGTVQVGAMNVIYFFEGERLECTAWSEIPFYEWASREEARRLYAEACAESETCEVVSSCPTDWISACENYAQPTEGDLGDIALSVYRYSRPDLDADPNDPGFQEFCTTRRGTFRTNF